MALLMNSCNPKREGWEGGVSMSLVVRKDMSHIDGWGEVGRIKRVRRQVLCGNKRQRVFQQCLLGHQPLFWSEVSQAICLEHSTSQLDRPNV